MTDEHWSCGKITAAKFRFRTLVAGSSQGQGSGTDCSLVGPDMQVSRLGSRLTRIERYRHHAASLRRDRLSGAVIRFDEVVVVRAVNTHTLERDGNAAEVGDGHNFRRALRAYFLLAELKGER